VLFLSFANIESHVLWWHLFSVQDLAHAVQRTASSEPLDLALVHGVHQLDVLGRTVGVLNSALNVLLNKQKLI
jgi:hypothetical protein